MSHIRVWNGQEWRRTTTQDDYLSSMIGSTSMYIGRNPIDVMLSTHGATWAHRGGSASWPEMTKYAYDNALAAGYGALEVSFGRTLDGVWFGLHDSTLDRTSGISGGVDPNNLTWAEIRGYYQVTIGASGAPQPYMSWDEFLTGLPERTIIILDPKANTTAMTEIMARARSDWGVDKTIIKYYGAGPVAEQVAATADSMGFNYRWGYFYESNYTNGSLDQYQDMWSILGMDYTASDDSWAAVKSYNKKVCAHILPSLTAYNTALAKGADMGQVAAVAKVPAVNTWFA